MPQTNNETKHTPTPWVLTKYPNTGIEDDKKRFIATTGSYNDGSQQTHDENIANAELIVTAVNSYEKLKQQRDELLEGLKGILKRNATRNVNKLILLDINILNSLIKKIEGKI